MISMLIEVNVRKFKKTINFNVYVNELKVNLH
jgi:hypothetical protein